LICNKPRERERESECEVAETGAERDGKRNSKKREINVMKSTRKNHESPST